MQGVEGIEDIVHGGDINGHDVDCVRKNIPSTCYDDDQSHSQNHFLYCTTCCSRLIHICIQHANIYVHTLHTMIKYGKL